MRSKILTYLCCAVIMLSSVSVFAEIDSPPPEPKPAGPAPPGLPIDGGISLLLIAGTAYGVYAIKKIKKF